jgi:exonuclease V gamma subunit
VISDLLDMIDDVFELDVGRARQSVDGESVRLRDWLVVSHPLQTSSARYFETSGDSRLLGRDEEAFRGARARREASDLGGGGQRRFLAAAGDRVGVAKTQEVATEGNPADDAMAPVSLDALIRRILRSTRTFAREVLHLRLPRPEASVEDLDPIEIAGLSQYALGTAMLDMLRDGASAEQTVERLMAHASVPVSVAGRVSLAAMRAEVEEIAGIAAARCDGEPLEELNFSLELHDPGRPSDASIGTLVGLLDRLWPGGRIQLGFTRIGRGGELDLWIRHLVLCSLVEDGADRVCRSVFVGRTEARDSHNRVVVFGPVADARRHLGQLFAWAMTTPDAPLPFFPRTSRVFATRLLNDKEALGWREAYQEFDGSEGSNRMTPESQEELEMARIWEGWSPLAASEGSPGRVPFDTLAEEFFRPLLAVREVHER